MFHLTLRYRFRQRRFPPLPVALTCTGFKPGGRLVAGLFFTATPPGVKWRHGRSRTATQRIGMLYQCNFRMPRHGRRGWNCRAPPGSQETISMKHRDSSLPSRLDKFPPDWQSTARSEFNNIARWLPRPPRWATPDRSAMPGNKLFTLFPPIASLLPAVVAACALAMPGSAWAFNFEDVAAQA